MRRTERAKKKDREEEREWERGTKRDVSERTTSHWEYQHVFSDCHEAFSSCDESVNRNGAAFSRYLQDILRCLSLITSHEAIP